MKKRLLSLFLVFVTLLGILPTAALAANTEEEALGEVDIYNGGYELSYLTINGRIRTQDYTYFNYVDAKGQKKEVPAYCVNPNIKGVPQTVGVGESIQYLANERSSDPKVVGIISNGYPHRSLGELKLDNKYQAYYATKMALWCYLLPNWNIANLKVAPGLTGSELDIGNRILAAAKDIYKRGTIYNYMLEPRMTATPDKSVAYSVTVDGKQYKQQVFTIWSETWVYDYDVAVSFADPGSVPQGTRIVDENDQDITAVTTKWTGDGYGGKFKVLYPADSIEGESGSVQLSLTADVAQYAAMYAVCQEKDKYGNLQNYICDLDNSRHMELAAMSSYTGGGEPDPEETALKIVKLEEGTKIPLSLAAWASSMTAQNYTTFSTMPWQCPTRISCLWVLTCPSAMSMTRRYPKKDQKEENLHSMRDKYILTAESVTEGHPDKLCDTIADAVLDACLLHDPSAHVACEVMATAGKLIVAGEITATELPDIPAIACSTACKAGYPSLDYEVEVITRDQSPDIAGAVSQEDQLGAGDQGIMYGHACSETEELLPLPVVLANRLTCLLSHVRRTGRIQGLGPDGKAQVSVEYVFGQPSRITSVVVSCQHDPDKDMEMLRREIQTEVIQPALRELPPDEGTEILINPSGRFVLGGFEADTGLTGRKLMVDTYGGLAPHGGGALSGKDGSKVDRSGTYMARYIAKNIVAAGLAEKCTVSLAYAIGKAEPVAVDIDTHGSGEYGDDVLAQAVRQVFELTPAGMIRTLGLDKPIFAQFCNYGHFTHQDAPWEQCDRAELLWNVCRVKEAGVSSR